MRNLVVAVAVVSLAGVASAQSKNPMSYEAMAKAKKGAWAEYTMSMAGQAQKLTVRYAVVDKNEPPMPGHIKLNQAVHFAEAMVRGEKNTKEIAKTILEDKIREVI